MFRSSQIGWLTTSEGQLKRFGLICHLHYYKNRQQRTKTKLINLISKANYLTKNQRKGLTNQKVIDRHISVMIKLGLLDKSEVGVNLTADGKAIAKYLEVDNAINTFELSKFERLFYIKKLIEYCNDDFKNFLSLIKKNSSLDNLIIAYFKLSAKENISRTFTNHITTLLMWAKSLKLIEYSKKEIRLNHLGSVLVNYWGKNSYKVLNSVLSTKHQDIDLKIRLLETIRKYKEPGNIINFASIRSIFCIKCLVDEIVIDENIADETLRIVSIKKGFSINVDNSGRPGAILI